MPSAFDHRSLFLAPTLAIGLASAAPAACTRADSSPLAIAAPPSLVESTGAPAARSPEPLAQAAGSTVPAPAAGVSGVMPDAPAGATEPGPDRGGDAETATCPPPPAGMACIPAGPFVRGVDDDEHQCAQPDQVQGGQHTTGPAATIDMPTYFMDLTEVTNEAYAACVDAGACPDSGPRYVDFDRPAQPIVGVSWFDARTYCAWAGKHLPTEAEWEKAARGTEGTRTPFGDGDASCEDTILMDAAGRSCGQQKERGEHPETGRVALVGSRRAGHFGLFDMVGNAEEWVADWWTESYASCGADCDGPDPRGPCEGADECPGARFRVVRGGSWYWPTEHATGYHRRRHYPSNSPFHHFGFRCAARLDDGAAQAARDGD